MRHVRAFIAALILLMVGNWTLSSEPVSVGTPVDEGSAVDILVWTPYSGPSLDWLTGQLDTFGMATGTSIIIEQFTLGELRKQVILGEGERIADVLVGVPHDELHELVDLGLLADVSNYATAEYLADLPVEASLAFRHGRALLGLPLTLEGPALLVNMNLVSEIPEAYGDFLELASRIERGLNSGFRFDFGNFYFSWAWFRAHGAEIFETGSGPPTGRIAIASEEAAAGAEALQHLRHGLGLIPAGTDYQSAHELFASGRLAFTYNGPWSIAHYFEAGVPLTVVPMPPVNPGGHFSGFMSVQGVLMTSSAPDPVSAANAAKWLVRSGAQLELAETAGRIPASMQAVDSLSHDEILYGFGMALRNAQAVPADVLMSAVWQPMGRFLQTLDERVHTSGQLLELLQQAESDILGR